MMNNQNVAILLATYNGGKYISDQIESILSQSYRDFHIYVRDDGSNDDTMHIVDRYVKEHEKISKVINENPRKGAAINFGSLMTEVSALGNYEYFMFCDQDDIWLENKIQFSLQSIIEAEKRNEINHPVLVHTDFQYVDSNLNHFDVKDNVAKKLSKVEDKIKIIANDNYIFGCTMIINRSLLDLSLPIPKEAENHDFWIALHAAVFGKIVYFHTKTMLYRQHGENVTGGLDYSTVFSRIKRLSNFRIYFTHKNRRLIQFNAFLQKEKTRFSAGVYHVLNQYMQHSLHGGLDAVFFMYKSGFRMRGIGQTIIYYISIFLDKKVDLSKSGSQRK